MVLVPGLTGGNGVLCLSSQTRDFLNNNNVNRGVQHSVPTVQCPKWGHKGSLGSIRSRREKPSSSQEYEQWVYNLPDPN